ncbi:MAG: transcriptional repressor general negative regulator of transcription subunit 4 [Peltula sp. TS41687]|nr:MAG: transcriptional repressor general negative regulator of transcription subunit 4 [Peltula sp. TS41687]
MQSVVNSTASPMIKPALPIIPKKPSVAVAPEEKKLSKQEPDSSQSRSSGAIQNAHTTSANAAPVSSHAPVTKPGPVDAVRSTDENTAPGNDGKSAVISTSAPSISTTNTSKKGTKEGIKRSPPGKLDIAAATRNLIRETQVLSASGSSKSEGNKNANSTRSSATLSAVTDSRPTPTSAFTIASQGPLSVRSAQPKTLRLISTPKTETPPPLHTLPTTTTTANVTSPVIQLPFQKQTATASINRPATPASESIVDTASQASATISQTSSPPPSTAGSVTTRNLAKMAKNLRKKQRKEDEQKKAEMKEVDSIPVSPVIEEKEIAPIIGRKKKKMKQKGTTAEDSTPSVSRPPSPGLEADIPKDMQAIATTEASSDSQNVKETKEEEPMPAAKEGYGASAALEKAAHEGGEESTPKSTELSATSVINHLIASEEIHPSETALFKAMTTNPTPRPENLSLAGGILEVNRKIIITETDQAKLASGLPVTKVTERNDNSNSSLSRATISPGGYLLRGLSPDSEQRFLRLEQSISEPHPPMAFTHTRHHGLESGFYMVGGRVNQGRAGPVPIQTTSDTLTNPTQSSAAMARVRVQEALNYINQFVLPALPTHGGKLDSAANGNNPFTLNPGSSSNLDRTGRGAGNNNSPADTGRAPDPSTYTAHISPVTSTTTSSTTASGSVDVSHVVHGMVAGLAPAGSSGVRGAAAAAAAAASRGGTLSSVPLLSADECEAIYSQSKKEAEGLEKKLNGLIKKNRKLVFGSSGLV